MPRWLNVTNLLLLLGLLVLAGSFYAPYGTARRVHRIEGRAQEITQLLLDATQAVAPAALDEASRTQVLERVRTACRAFGYPESALPSAGPPAPAGSWFFVGKHYAYMVTTPPRDALGSLDAGAGGDDGAGARDGGSRGTDRSEGRGRAPDLEVYGWPLSNLGPGRTVFYFPSSGAAAYSRNMSASYAGFADRPERGSGGQRSAVQSSGRGQYWYRGRGQYWDRGRDEERWILFASS